MLVFISVLLSLIVAAAILYPFLRGMGRYEPLEDESSPQAELRRRWDAALAGLKNSELEWAIGNLAKEDYLWLRRQYVMEAALVMKAMQMEEGQEEELLNTIKLEVRQVRSRAVGQDGYGPGMKCPHCSSEVERGLERCASCGEPVAAVGPEAARPSGEATGE